MTIEDTSIQAKAEQVWEDMTDNERFGVKFGMFPHDKMKAVEDEGFKGHDICVALMNIAKQNRG